MQRNETPEQLLRSIEDATLADEEILLRVKNFLEASEEPLRMLCSHIMPRLRTHRPLAAAKVDAQVTEDIEKAVGAPEGTSEELSLEDLAKMSDAFDAKRRRDPEFAAHVREVAAKVLDEMEDSTKE